ncbi:hypothetical protein [Sphingomonas paeninsulae]|uniref:hypothetical protein n=1 Tax=Sphingomonas paeninsulae TaxID=2319844 RepID=UPI0013CE56E3|nr:hypothetical protein [Sphingomonas paeninsulae]
MPEPTHIIQRAFQLARQGQCMSVDEIRATLTDEGYESVRQHMAGTGLARQLRGIIAAAKAPGA